MRIFVTLAACTLFAGTLLAQSGSTTGESTPLEPSPEFSIDNIDTTVNPCTDFISTPAAIG